MIDRLDQARERYEQLAADLARPENASSPTQLRRLGRELAQLEPLVKLREAWLAAQARAEEARELLDSPEPELAALADEEFVAATAELEHLKDELYGIFERKDRDDERNALLEIRAGTGGEEAALFAAELQRMYARFAERRGLKMEVLSINETGLGGIREVIARVSGPKAFGLLRHESGVHRVQRVPATEASGRIHTSAASVAVLPEAEEVEVHIPESDIRVDVFRASGHGGQSVNTTDSAVRVTHLPTNTVVAIQDERSQLQNRARALAILRARLLDEERRRQAQERGETRRGQIGTGDRSEKVRTYNFPQDRVTDHRIALTLHNLPAILDGGLDRLVEALQTRAAEERLAAQEMPS